MSTGPGRVSIQYHYTRQSKTGIRPGLSFCWAVDSIDADRVDYETPDGHYARLTDGYSSAICSGPVPEALVAWANKN